MVSFTGCSSSTARGGHGCQGRRAAHRTAAHSEMRRDAIRALGTSASRPSDYEHVVLTRERSGARVSGVARSVCARASQLPDSPADRTTALPVRTADYADSDTFLLDWCASCTIIPRTSSFLSGSAASEPAAQMARTLRLGRTDRPPSPGARRDTGGPTRSY